MIKNISMDSLNIFFSKKCNIKKRKKVSFLEKENNTVIKNIQDYKEVEEEKQEPIRKRPRSNAIVS
jgi:hypothetical protein